MKRFKKVSMLFLLVLLVNMMVMPISVNAAAKLNKKSITLNVKKKYTLKASGTSGKIVWTSSNKKVATVSSKGVVKALKKGKTVITAKYGKKKLTCKVTVKQPVTGIKLNKTSVTLEKGSSFNLTAKVSPGTANNKAVTWKSSNSKVATVSATGTVKIVGVGKATITATAKDGSKVKAKCSISAIEKTNTAFTKLKEYAVQNGFYFTSMGVSGYKIVKEIPTNYTGKTTISLTVYTSIPEMVFVYAYEENEGIYRHVSCDISDCTTLNRDGTYGKPEFKFFYFSPGNEEEGYESTRVGANNKITGYNYTLGHQYDFEFDEDNNDRESDPIFVWQMNSSFDELFQYATAYILSKTGVSFADIGFKNLNLNM